MSLILYLVGHTTKINLKCSCAQGFRAGEVSSFSEHKSCDEVNFPTKPRYLRLGSRWSTSRNDSSWGKLLGTVVEGL